MSVPTGNSLAGFTVHELPSEKWLKFVSPKVRLRVRGKKCNFVSSVVKVNNQKQDVQTDETCTHWHWNDERSPRPSLADNELFEVEVERRFLLWYTCIRRTKQVTIRQVRTGDRDHCTLPLYDGEHTTWELEDKIEIGKVTFALS